MAEGLTKRSASAVAGLRSCDGGGSVKGGLARADARVALLPGELVEGDRVRLVELADPVVGQPGPAADGPGAGLVADQAQGQVEHDVGQLGEVVGELLQRQQSVQVLRQQAEHLRLAVGFALGLAMRVNAAEPLGTPGSAWTGTVTDPRALVTVTDPPQPSEAVAVPTAGGFSVQEMLVSAGKAVNTGLTLSTECGQATWGERRETSTSRRPS